jgi:hypothetical protein
MKVCDLKWGWFDIAEINICWLMLGIGISNNLMIEGASDACNVIAQLSTQTSKKHHYLVFGKIFLHSFT